MQPNQPFELRPPEVTRLLNEMRAGNEQSADQLVACLYKELRRLAAYQMRAERSNHTLQPTALVHEMFIRVLGAENVEWQNRAHFFAVAARQMRNILVDHARAVKAEKRGGGVKVSLEEAGSLAGKPEADLLVVDEALSNLEGVDPRAAKVVELKFFSGLTDREAAEVLKIPVISVRRDWDFAKAWLFHRLTVAPGG